ncbi:hypothetical protein AWH56_020985 [Anaerobacillus isosaccharinicus]|uniref:DUF3899 domain-containing protein n=1 Tax=Anaerobacillus isosaccharinicus TaxID=1532552 RepID=A0A1S2LHP1_9BACI|nr:hypothetical protein [Anaerobacillus isosaccharinicus]MBA5586615.1 hypothetical protein [Anaerobacillus isosaccharinicus]QOY35151.1 hypothetical protein AWH56_020985 [Anaerobacillus isosaccharinicus]
MFRYLSYSLLVLAVELGILFGISFYFEVHLLSTLFFGSVFFVFFAFLLGSSGDMLSKKQELAAFQATGGRYIPKYEKLTLTVGPLLVGSVLCFLAYFVFSYFIS